jgi:very-short-patch-repair endonuclease
MDSGALSKITIDLILAPVINFAMQQNHVPVVKRLLITNISDVPLENLWVKISTEPDFSIPWTAKIDLLKPEESHSFGAVPINLSPVFLAELTERISGHLHLKVKTLDETLLESVYEIDLLAYDQWNGAGSVPELIAAFITPNHPEIPYIIRIASTLMMTWTGDPSFNAYQSRNPDRVKKQMAALYEAIASLDLIYCPVPASFEETGQRVRLTDAILAQKLASCLDLSLLYAACLEAVGINPLIVMIKGHAFAGAWLVDESFPDAVNDDPSLITKRTAAGINDIVVLESTCMNAGNHPAFDKAVQSADAKMLETTNFQLFVDVKRARFGGVRPLPIRIPSPQGWEIKYEENPALPDFAPEEITLDNKPGYTDKIAVSKQQLWERKLLDLTLRNTLLNTRMTKSVIQFISVNSGKLEDALAEGKEFQILAKPSDWSNTPRDAGIYQAVNTSDPIADLVSHELTQQRLRTYLTEAELNINLTNIFRVSRLSLEENGANTLYVGIGLLKWYETPASERPRFAPVLLLPVEIIRKSAQKGYVIRSREEETILNITLLEMMRQDFGISIAGLETLPKDHSGVDVRGILNTVRQAIMSQPRWDVEDQALLGIFSFNKFILWNDIHNNSVQLAQNKVVASLITGKLQLEPSNKVANLNINPGELALPISTDSSQLRAVISSANGESFVLHGPPGTGKSQTITNIIANALYSGKKVLFVSAKKAALEVVQKRLQAIGIGDFCLELHSNKSKKSDVLAQLKKATEVIKKDSPEYFLDTAERLLAVRNELNVYVEALHRKNAGGYTLFELFCNYAELEKTAHAVYFSGAETGNLNAREITRWDDLASELETVAAIIPDPAHHPLKAIHLQAYSQQVKADAQTLMEQTLVLLSQVEKSLGIVTAALGFSGNLAAQTDVLGELIGILLQMPDSPPTFLTTESLEQTLAKVIGVAGHGKQRDALRSDLLQTFTKSILEFPAEQVLAGWEIAGQKWFLPKWIKQRAIIKSIKSKSRAGNFVNEEIPGLLNKIIAYQSEQAIIDTANYLPALADFLWKNGEADWDILIKVSSSYIALNRAANKLTGLDNISYWRNSFGGNLREGSGAYLRVHEPEFRNFIALSGQLKTFREKLQALFGTELNEIRQQCETWLMHLDALKDWFTYTTTRQLLAESGLTAFITAFEEGELQAGQVFDSYKKGLYKSIADHIIENNPALSGFHSQLFEGKIRKFRELSDQFEKLTREELYARLAARTPSFTQEAAQSSEIGLLQRTLRNNGRAMPIRKLFDLIPNVLPRLTPCMLMSPISVAQYFDAGSAKFDLVVFDEASQMPTCEAVGAIARGNSLIVVGDPKQMPPTSFFSTNNFDEENVEQEDLESILDDCLALSMPSYHLLWHYRSKHESLIAFSNAMYYDNSLRTFPSTDDLATKVKLVKVKGFYDRGKTKQNRFEAKAIVDYIIYRLSNPQLSKRSLGVVTFSSVQQSLIEDLLTDTFLLRPDLEKIAYEGEEPLFVKNLENVQGDERDIILFSIGYGPDEAGKIGLNFGPINREGGWRRLNVAVSRARYEMQVFSTLRADHIDLNRSNAEGVAGLKAFLSYAEKGRQALPSNLMAAGDYIPGTESFIADGIRKHGYKVHTNIGCSSYKIDIGIVHPDYPNQYLLAVLCDGHTYMAAKTPDDREIVQPGVLKSLGWNVMKVWSTEWWENPDKVIQEILAAIHKAEQGIKPEPEPIAESVPEEKIPFAFKETKITVTQTLYYEAANVQVVRSTSSEDFFLYGFRETIKSQINEVLAIEAPVSKNLLSKRVLLGWGIGRMGSRIAVHFELIYKELSLRQTTDNGNIIFWRADQQPDDYAIYRLPPNEALKRDADDLPSHEIANGIREILQNQISLTKDDLVKEAARLFGYARIGTNVEVAMHLGLRMALSKGFAKMENERVVCV